MASSLSENKPRILINMHYLHLGGAETALLQLLHSLHPERVEVDLLINSHEGELMDRLPKWVNLLPEPKKWRDIERPIMKLAVKGEIGMVWRRLRAKFRHRRFVSATPLPPEAEEDASVFHYVGEEVVPLLPKINPHVRYDLAVSFMRPHQFVREKINARKYAAWIHTDYLKSRVNVAEEEKVWAKYDSIIAVSEESAAIFRNVFPSLASKVSVIENFISPDFVKKMADVKMQPQSTGTIRLLTLGRICRPKNLIMIPSVAYHLRRLGVDFLWEIAGTGNPADINYEIRQKDVADYVRFIGPIPNPYPHLATCDVYVQPSLYEGKSVAVEEAKALGKPVVLTPYPTASGQIENRVNGIIASDMNPYSVALAVKDAITDRNLTANARRYCAEHARTETDSAINAFYALIPELIPENLRPIPRTIHYCWFGGKPLPEKVKSLMQTWMRRGWRIHRWDETNFPTDNFPYASDAYKAGNYAFVSDVCRAYALEKEGGVYLDTDVELIADFEPFLSKDAFMGFEGTKFVATAVMGFRAGHPFLSELLDFYRNNRYMPSLATTNVVLVTDMLSRKGLRRDGSRQNVAGIEIYPKQYFSPFDYVDGRLTLTSETVSIHWFSQAWIGNNPPLRRRLSTLYHRIRGVHLE